MSIKLWKNTVKNQYLKVRVLDGFTRHITGDDLKVRTEYRVYIIDTNLPFPNTFITDSNALIILKAEDQIRNMQPYTVIEYFLN